MEVSPKDWMSMLLTRYTRELELRIEAVTKLHKEVNAHPDCDPVPDEVFERWNKQFEGIRDGSFFEK